MLCIFTQHVFGYSCNYFRFRFNYYLVLYSLMFSLVIFSYTIFKVLWNLLFK